LGFIEIFFPLVFKLEVIISNIKIFSFFKLFSIKLFWDSSFFSSSDLYLVSNLDIKKLVLSKSILISLKSLFFSDKLKFFSVRRGNCFVLSIDMSLF